MEVSWFDINRILINSEKKLLLYLNKLQEVYCLLPFNLKEEIENSYNQKESHDCFKVRPFAKKEKTVYLIQASEVIQ